MNINIKIFFFFVLLNLLLVMLLGDLWLMIDNARDLTEVQVRRYESRQLADELRHSSDDLTRMARTYVVTGDPLFLRYFEEIIAIRDGQAPRPDNDQGICWDFVSGQNDFRIGSGRKVSIIDLVKELHFTDSELALLNEAKKQSEELTHIEVQAFNALKGLYLGDDGKYSVDGKPDPELARQMVFSASYHQAKASIMAKIEEFFSLLNVRTLSEVQHGANMQKRYLAVALLLSAILFGMGSVGYWFFRKDITKPLKGISEWIKRMHDGEYNFNAETYRKDEIGMLAHAFVDMAQQVANHIAVLEHVSRTDPLTKINNRITLDKALYSEMYKFGRYGTPCSIIMIDVDHFKNVNDCFGHVKGDKVLIEIAGILLATTRESDISGRWGGEEFLVICPNTDLTGGRTLAELIRKRIDQQEFDEIGNITVSLGVSVLRKEESIEDTIKRADKSLYQAKSEGRNRVCSPDF